MEKINDCKVCDGYGYLRQFDGDEIEMVTCNTCNARYSLGEEAKMTDRPPLKEH